MSGMIEQLRRWLPTLSDEDAARCEALLRDSPDLRRRLAIVSTAADPFLARLLQKAQNIDSGRPHALLDSSGHLPVSSQSSQHDALKESTLDCRPRAAPEPSRHPELFLQYELHEVIGEGGMGFVRRAVHTALKREVAIKFIKADISEHALKRFEREIEAIGKLKHPNIVDANDAGTHAGKRYLVMEYVDGTDISRIVRCRGALPLAEACEIARQAAEGLQHIHDNGMVHRDIKPSNLILSRPTAKTPATVKILDLGLAQHRAAQGTQLTQAGMAMGTYLYMAPEQAKESRKVDIRADIYSLGCTLYELLAGQPPFSGDRGLMSLMLAHAHEPPPCPPLRDRKVPRGLETAVLRMLSKSPAERFETPRQLIQALEPYCRGHDLDSLLEVAFVPTDHGSRSAVHAASRPSSRTVVPASSIRVGRLSREKWMVLTGVALVLLAVGTGVALLSGGNSDATVVARSDVTSAASTETPVTPQPPNELELAPASEPSQGPPPAVPAQATPDPVPEPAPEPATQVVTRRPVQDQIRPGEVAGEAWSVNSLEMPFRWCPEGRFQMGSPSSELGRSETEEQVDVTLSHGFWMSEFEVSQRDWTRIMETSLSEQRGRVDRPDPINRGVGEEFPVYYVNAEEADEFCRRLTESEREFGQLPDTWSYQLPTEAQWEYACRAGSPTATAFGNTLDGTQANFDGEFPYNSVRPGPSLQSTVPITGGSYRANRWGLRHLHGNVREWCRDAFLPRLRGGQDPEIPAQPGQIRSVRGGSWFSIGLGCRSADRTGIDPKHRDATLGFRVVVVEHADAGPRKE